MALTDTLDEVQPLPSGYAVVYASAEDLLTVGDLPERNITIRRWQKGGAPLVIRIRALDLDQQDRINQESLIRNPKTGAWEQSTAAFCAASLRELCVSPKLTNEQAQAMRKRNPDIIRKIVDFGWFLGGLDDETIERAARAMANPEPSPSPDAGDPPGNPL